MVDLGKTAAVALGLLLASMLPASAEDRIAIKPGVMCASAAALGALTLPNGDSRTHQPHPTGSDLELARSGGCIDVPIGAQVTVQQTFRNTSIITYGPFGTAPLVIANVDFQPAVNSADVPVRSGEALPPGYRVQQGLAVNGPGSNILEVHEDRRISAEYRARLWESGDPGGDLPAVFNNREPLNAEVVLLSPSGAVLSRRMLDVALAQIKPSGLHGLPYPTFFLEADYSAGTGASGPLFQLLSPYEAGVQPVTAIADHGGREQPLQFWNVLRAHWRIVPFRPGVPEEIISVSCSYDDGSGRPLARYMTFRFRDGRWHVASRDARECDDYEVSPPRGAFP